LTLSAHFVDFGQDNVLVAIGEISNHDMSNRNKNFHRAVKALSCASDF